MSVTKLHLRETIDRNKHDTHFVSQLIHILVSDGFYIYTDIMDLEVYLYSPEMPLTSGDEYCLTFWYYVYGAPQAGELRCA